MVNNDLRVYALIDRMPNACKETLVYPLEQAIQGKITFIDLTTAETMGCRYIASELVRIIFEYMARGDWQGDFPARINNRTVKKQSN